MEIPKIVEELLADKAANNNTIDLDAYANGLLDMYQALQLHKTQVSGSVLTDRLHKSKISEKILSETTEEIKNKAREYGNSLVNEWISFDEKYPEIYKNIFAGQWDIVKKRFLEQKAMLTENGLELIFDIGNLESEINKPTHWKYNKH